MKEKPTATAISEFWPKILSEHGFGRMPRNFTVEEMGMASKFIKSMGNGDAQKIVHLIEFCVSHWKQLREKVVWESTKKTKLPEVPSFKEIYFNRDVMYHYYKHRDEVQTADEKTTVYTTMDHVPKDHPMFKQIERAIRNSGKAVVHH